MKKILITTLVMAAYGCSYSQAISFEDPIIVKRPKKDSIVNITFYIPNEDSSKYKVKVTDLHKGSAQAGRDYQFNFVYLINVIGKGTFTLVIKPDSTGTKKTINLKISAATDDSTRSSKIKDTVYYSEIKIILTKKLTKRDINNNSVIDLTNTPKFEFINYTDFKGFDQDQPNGIAQSQFLFKLPINKYCHKWNDGETKLEWFRSFILPDFIFNRIDKTNEPVSLKQPYSKYKDRNNNDSFAISPIINTFDFIRYSNFIFNSKLIILSFLRPKSRFQIQLNGSLYKIKVDSVTIKTPNDTTSTALSPVWATGFGAELYYDTRFSSDDFPFNFRFIIGSNIVRNRSGEYKQADIASTSPDKSSNTALVLGKSHRFSFPIWNLSAMISKGLDLKKGNSTDDHYFFFRFNYSWQSFKGNVLLSKTPVKYETRKLNNNFAQFQLGVDLNFDGVFK
jgi:hypothetical protein